MYERKFIYGDTQISWWMWSIYWWNHDHEITIVKQTIVDRIRNEDDPIFILMDDLEKLNLKLGTDMPITLCLKNYYHLQYYI